MKRIICILMVCIMILIKPTAAMAETNEKTQQQNFYKQEYLIKQYVRNSDVRLIETIDIGKYNMARSSTRVSDKTYKVSYKKIAALSGDASSGLGLAFFDFREMCYNCFKSVSSSGNYMWCSVISIRTHCI